MKRIICAILLLVFTLCMFGCQNINGNKKAYKLTLENEDGHLVYPLQESYQAGEKVEVVTGIIMDADLVIYLNDEPIEMIHSDVPYWKYEFTMPNKDSVLRFSVESGLPYYYGIYNEYHFYFIPGEDLVLTTETIDGVKFNYNDSGKIYGCKNDEQLTLQECFDRGIITHDNLVEINELHKNDFPFMYEDENTYTLNEVLGFDKSEITKIQYTGLGDDMAMHEVNLEETIEKLDVEYVRTQAPEPTIEPSLVVTPSNLLCYFVIYKNEERINCLWSSDKTVLISKSEEEWYKTKEPVELYREKNQFQVQMDETINLLLSIDSIDDSAKSIYLELYNVIQHQLDYPSDFDDYSLANQLKYVKDNGKLSDKLNTELELIINVCEEIGSTNINDLLEKLLGVEIINYTLSDVLGFDKSMSYQVEYIDDNTNEKNNVAVRKFISSITSEFELINQSLETGIPPKATINLKCFNGTVVARLLMNNILCINGYQTKEPIDEEILFSGFTTLKDGKEYTLSEVLPFLEDEETAEIIYAHVLKDLDTKTVNYNYYKISDSASINLIIDNLKDQTVTYNASGIFAFPEWYNHLESSHLFTVKTNQGEYEFNFSYNTIGILNYNGFLFSAEAGNIDMLVGHKPYVSVSMTFDEFDSFDIDKYIEEQNTNVDHSFTDSYMKNPLYTTYKYFDLKLAEDVEFDSVLLPLSDVTFKVPLNEAFNTTLTDEYLIDNFYAYYYVREEGILSEYLQNVTYDELFIEQTKFYISRHYEKTLVAGETVIVTYPEIILIPKSWIKPKEDMTKIMDIPLEINIVDDSTGERYNIMSYEKMLELKEAQINRYLEPHRPEKVYIYNAYGEYNGALVVYMSDSLSVYTEALVDETIAGYEFHYNNGNTIRVYINGEFMNLQKAFNEGILTFDDIIMIHFLYKRKGTFYFHRSFLE